MQALADPKNYARAFLNPPDNAANLSPQFLASLANLPERQRKRFFDGVYVDELDGALWSYEIIESCALRAERYFGGEARFRRRGARSFRCGGTR